MKTLQKFFLSLVLLFFCTAPCFAAETTTIDLIQGSVSLTTPGTYYISGYGVQTTNTISISGSGQYYITIDQINIQSKNAFSITGSAEVYLTLSGENTYQLCGSRVKRLQG